MENNDYKELYHHGVKGQKWGVRRMQDKMKKQESKTRIAELKALEAESNKATRELNKSDKKIRKEKQQETVQKGKNAATTALGVIGLATLSAVIVRKFMGRGKSAAKVG